MTDRIKSIIIWAFSMLCLTISAPLPADQTFIDAPGFTLFDTSGKQISLHDYRDQYVILNFWAFWCDTWKQELPSLIDLSGDEQKDHFKLLAISVDGSRLPLFQHDTSGKTIPFPVLLDTSSAVSRSFAVTHVPTVIILDSSGKIRYSTYGYPGNHALLSALRKLESSEQ